MHPARRPALRVRQMLVAGLAAGVTALLALAGWPGTAAASHGLTSIVQDDRLLSLDPADALAKMRQLGAQQVRVAVRWDLLSPNANSFRFPRGFHPANPGAYKAALWRPYDTIVRDAAADGIQVNFNVVGGGPLWATGPGMPRHIKGYPFHQWEPKAGAFRAFVTALGTRYSGNYNPSTNRTSPGNPGDLPRVSVWSIWNEPDYGPSLAPQALPGHPGVEDSPRMYRALVDAAWSALHRTGHGSDTFVFGELAPRGTSTSFGDFNGMLPLVFVRALYCLDAGYRPLRGRAAALRGCPTTPAASRRFRAQHPALFDASGFSDHPYMRWYPPNREANSPRVRDFAKLVKQFTTFATIGNLEVALNRALRPYGSRRRFPIWNTEFGYITDPPKRIWRKNRYPYVSPATAAYYDNWAEYLSWRNPRIATFEQYLLQDPLPATAATNYGGFASGLITYPGKPKPGFGAWRMPLFLPHSVAARPSQPLEVWGGVRPVQYAYADDPSAPELVQIMFQPAHSRSWSILDTLTLSRRTPYFDVRERFPSSGTVMLKWVYPEGSLSGMPGQAVYSRHAHVTVK